MKYDLILFDADGTLFDFDKAEFAAYEKTMNHFGVEKSITELHKKYEIINKAIWKDFERGKISSINLRTERFRRFFEQEKLDLKPEIVSPIYLKNLSMGTQLIEGAVEIVQALVGKVEIALATNGLADVQNPRFAASKLAKYFKHIFISEEIGFPKPRKEYFDHIFKQLPFRNSAIIIGDNLASDIKGGNDFGIDTCWFNPKGLKNKTEIIPDFEIKNLNELENIVN